MPKQSDREYLLGQQYRNASNLKARIALHQRFSTNTCGWHRWVFDQFDLPRQSSLLELGCGPGTLWLENLDRIPPGWHVTLSDFSVGMIRTARDSLIDQHFLTTCFLIDAQGIPCRDGSLDAVIANHMLYHIPNRSKALSEIRRVLRPGGCLYAATNGTNHMRELRELVAQADPQASQRFAPPEHNFSLDNAQAQLRQWFPEIRLQRYDDSLLVTDVDALTAYVTSGRTLDAEGITRLEKHVKERITRDGAIRITKDTGVFSATA